MGALRAFTVCALAALFLLVCAPPMFENPPTQHTGVQFKPTGELVQPFVVRVDPNSPGYRAGLRTGDVVSCLSMRDNSILFYPVEATVPYTGTPVTLCAKRNGVWRNFTFVGSAGPPGGYWYGNVWIAALRLGVFAIFLLSGIALVLGRPSPMTWIFFVYCLASAPSIAFGANGVTAAPLLYAIGNMLVAVPGIFGVGFLLLFALAVPDDRIPEGWRRRGYWTAWIVTVGLIAFAVLSTADTSLVFAPAVSAGVDEALTIITVLVVFARLASMRAEERARFGWAAFAIIFGVITNDIRNLQVFQTPDLRPVGIGAALLTCVMPISLMYAILRRHVIDVRFVISRTVVFAAITTVVVAVIGVVDWATSVYLQQVRIAMALDAAVTIGLGFVLHRTYKSLEYAVDFVLYRKKHEATAYLDRLARTLLRADREDTVDRALVHDPYDKFDLTAAALFRAQSGMFIPSCSAGWHKGDAIAFERDHDVVRFLLTERSRLSIPDLRESVAAQFKEAGPVPAVAIPIFLGDELFAFAVYGIHRDGTKLDPDEVETLQRLCEAAAQAYVRIENLRLRAFTQSAIPAIST